MSYLATIWNREMCRGYTIHCLIFLMLLYTKCDVVLTVIRMSRASIMPSITCRLLVSPPAHKGPKMVARPPTERLTPWLNPFGEASQHRCTGMKRYFTIYTDKKYDLKVCFKCLRASYMLSSNLLFEYVGRTAHIAQW